LKQKTGKQSIEELKEEIIELQENLKSTKELLNRVKRILQEISRLQTRLSFVENELSILLSKTDSRIVDFILNYDNKSYHDLFKELYDKELTSHSQIVKSMEEQKRVIIERIDKANQELSKKKKDYERLSKKLEQIDNEIKKLQLALKELSSTGSFRSLVLENYLKELEESINYMLSHLNKDTFLKLYISGSGRNKGIQVSIFENNIEKSYSQLSTGERRFVDMSLLLTFSAFSPMDFVLIDEALDSLSFENQLKVVSLLSALDKQVFLVSHNEKMIDEISNDEKVSQIFITKENGISEVEVR
jgi:chromosome segregation ATPase